MLAPLADELTAWIAANIRLNPPTLSYFSNVTGGEADAALVCAPEYWARHMCQPVQFSAGAGALLADPELAVIEIGPGRSLTSLIRAAGCPPAQWPLMMTTLPAAADPRPTDAVFAECLAGLWLIGVDIDWPAHHGRRPGARPAYAGSPPGRIPLPTYPFERQRYWIERTAQRRNRGAELPAGPATFDDIDRLPRLPEEQWLNLPMWRQVAPTAADERRPASWLVFAREGEADRVLAELRRVAESDGVTLTVVRPGDCYRTTTDGFTVRPGSADDALDVLRQLRQRGVPLDRAVHLWTLDETPGDDDATVALGLHALVALARATGELGLTGWSLDIVTAGTQQVVDGGVVRPAAATVVGAARVIPLEYPSVVTRLIDAHPGTAAAQVVSELLRPRTESTVALRSGRRWLCGYQTAPAATPAETGAVLRENGVYLITGGLGGIGLSMAEHLARDCRARLVLFGRRGLPPREQWAGIVTGERAVEDSVRGRVARLVEIIALGAEVEVFSGDVAEPADVRRAVDRAHELFGGLHGVLHAAGVPGTGLMQFKQPGDSAQVLAPKLAGTRAIAEALRIGEPDETALDFLVLFSSIASATGGGPGQVDYCGANAYLDGYAAQLAATGRRALAVDWGEWVWNAWDEGLDGYDDALQAFFQKHRADFGITFEEGWRTLLRALASGESRVVVSTQDLTSILQVSSGFTVEAVSGPMNASSAGERHPRPELITPYQEPSGETQQKIAALWSQALRLDQIGAADNFFELGGNSLLGIALLAALRKSFTGAELAPHILHEAPTVAALARIVDRADGPATHEHEPDRGGLAQGQLRRAGLKAAAARRARS
jgi:acyl transferase domain-containing protein